MLPVGWLPPCRHLHRCTPALALAGGKSASATLEVPVARRPACASGASCLAAAPLSRDAGAGSRRRLLAGPPSADSFELSAAGFAADSPLTFDFGEQLANGRRDYHARDSASPTYAFELRTLPPGEHTLFACARGA